SRCETWYMLTPQPRYEFASYSRSADGSNNLPALPCGKALYGYEGKEPGDLQFSKGDIIILRRKVDDNWYHGELNGCHGFLPASYIQLLRPLSQTPPQGKALYDFEVKDKDQDKDCLAFSKNLPALPCGKALYAYEGKEPGDLQFSKGDIIILRRKVDDNWYHGELNGCHGFLPASYIQLLRPLSQTPPQGKALYDFEVKDKDQDKDCLAFSKDEVLTVIRRVDENWAEGMLGDKIGIFPILYVEMSMRSGTLVVNLIIRASLGGGQEDHILNETAKQLMEMDKSVVAPLRPRHGSRPRPARAPAPPAPAPAPAPLGPCSPGPSPGASPSNGNGGCQRRGEGKKNAKKRHSFTALSISQRAAQLHNSRHSMEISHPVLISSSDPRAAARIHDMSPAGPSPSSAGVLVPPRVASVTSELLAHAKSVLRDSYLALYAYKPQKADELELRKGEMYRVTEKCQDGWFKGTSLRTGATGVFPGNYVTPVSRSTGNTTDRRTTEFDNYARRTALRFRVVAAATVWHEGGDVTDVTPWCSSALEVMGTHSVAEEICMILIRKCYGVIIKIPP
ncbi:hypothetical protein CRUP_032582, partial [Coryphaenoides rupestris]